MIQVDVRGLKWPEATRVLSRTYKRAKRSDIIELVATGRDVEAAVRRWCKRLGCRVTKVESNQRVTVVQIEIR